MNRNILLVVTLSLLSVYSRGQASLTTYNDVIQVTGFKLLENDSTALFPKTAKIDWNGNRAALIKVKTPLNGIRFNGREGIVDMIEETDQILLYIPMKSKSLSITHNKYGSLNNYVYPVSILSGRTYEMTLSTGEKEIKVDCPDSVMIGENFIVTYEIDNTTDVKNVKLDGVGDDWEVVSGSNNNAQSNFQMTDGTLKSVHTIRYNYTVKAKKQGELVIPSLTATVDGRTLRSTAKKVMAIPEASAFFADGSELSETLDKTIMAKFKVGEEYFYNFWYEIGWDGHFNSVRKYKVVSKDPNGYTIELSYLANYKSDQYKSFTADLMTTIFNSLVGTKLIFKTDKNGHLIKLANSSEVQINAMRKITAAIRKMALDYPVLQNEQQRENVIDNIRKMLSEKNFINPESPENLLFSLYGKEAKLDNIETYYAEPRWAFLAGFAFKRSRQYKLSTEKGEAKFEVISQIDMTNSERKQMVLNTLAASNPQNQDYIRKVKDNIDVFLQNNGITDYKEDVKSTLLMKNNNWVRFVEDRRPYEPQKHQTTIISLIEQKDLNQYLSGRMR